MGYTPKNKIEKLAFFLAGVKKTGSANLQSDYLAVVANYWLTLSNTSTVYCTILLTTTVILFLETKLWYIYSLTAIGSIVCAIKTWVYSNCARETIKIWV